jgi:hypothetical protein
MPLRAYIVAEVYIYVSATEDAVELAWKAVVFLTAKWEVRSIIAQGALTMTPLFNEPRARERR